MGRREFNQFDASYTMAMKEHESRFTIYVFLHHCYCKGNDMSVMKIFSGFGRDDGIL